MKSFPGTVQIETTTKCDQNCWFCPRGVMKRKKDEFMSDELLEKVFDELQGKGVQVVHPFLYGEPFEDPRMFAIVDRIHSIGAKAFIYSNATLINEEVTKKIIAHGVDSLILTMTTNSKASGAVVENVLKFLKMKGNSLPKTEIKVVRKDGKDDGFLDFWSKVPNVNAWVSGVQSIAGHNFKPEKNETKGCNRMIGFITVLVNGDVCLCCNDYDCSELQGNINSQTMEDVFNGEEHKRLVSIYPNIKICQYCEDGSRF